MSKIALSGNASGTGTLTIAAPNTSTDRTLTLPDNTGTLVSTGSTAAVTQAMLATNTGLGGPSFAAELNGGGQSFTGSTNTKVDYVNEIFDSNGNYNTSDKRFTPNVAGYYFVGANLITAAASNGNNEKILRVYKNGTAEQFWSNNNQNATTHYNGYLANGIVFLNGTTDYIEAFFFTSTESTSAVVVGACRFYGFLIRAT